MDWATIIRELFQIINDCDDDDEAVLANIRRGGPRVTWAARKACKNAGVPRGKPRRSAAKQLLDEAAAASDSELMGFLAGAKDEDDEED